MRTSRWPHLTTPFVTLFVTPFAAPLAMLVAVASLLGTSSASAQATVVGPGSGAVTVRVSIAVPQTAYVRQILPTTVTVLPDGRREVAFNVVVTANCRWGLSVRPRALVDASSLPPIEVRNYLGAWVPLRPDGGAVNVEPEHAPCSADGVPVVLRMQNADHVALLSRVRFEVTPLD